MIRIKALLKKIPVPVLLWLKWLLFVVCVVALILTLTEINSRLLVDAKEPNQLFASWYGFRAFLVEGLNPYGSEMQSRIIESAAEINVVLDDASSYITQPLYSIVFYLPFIFIRDFEIAYTWWLTLLEVFAVFIAVLGVSLIKKDLKKNAVYIGFALLLMFASLAFHSNILNGSGAIFSFMLLFLTVKALQQGGDELAGVLLSLMTIFPFYGWISIVFLLIWTVRQRRYNVLWWMLGTVVLLGFAVALLEPQWLLFYLRMWVQYFNAVDIGFIFLVLDSVLPSTFLLPGFITGALVVLLLIEWAVAGRKNFILFYWTFQLTLVLESLLSMNINLISGIFVPTTLIFLLAVWEDRWKLKGKIVGVFVSILAIGLPWFLESVMGESGSVQSLLIVGAVAFLLLINLYWVRWWLTRNVLLWHSDTYSLENSGKANGNG